MEIKMKKIVCLFIFAFLPFIIFSQMRTTTSGHNGEIIALLNDPASKSDSFFCVGKDGFLSHWNNNQGNTYQLTDRQIKFAVIHPTKPEIAIYETDGNTENVVTVWDCQKLTKKFSVPFDDSILSLSYSKKGTYINIGTSTEAGTLFINSSNGNIEKPISEKMNMMSYVETTPSEKTFVSYSLTGNICYYYTDTKKQPKKIQTVTGFEPICTFANIRYIAGLKSGLVSIIDCVNGKTVFTQSASNACLFKVDDELYYFDQNSTKGGVINKIEFSESGLKSTPFEYIKFVNKDIITNIAKINDNLIFTSLNGDIYSAPFLKDETNTANLITYSNYQTINDGAFVNDTLYLLTNKSLFIVDELNGFDGAFLRHQDYEFLVRVFEKYDLAAIQEPLVIKNNENFNLPNLEKQVAIKKQYLDKFKYIIDTLPEKDVNFIMHGNYINVAENAMAQNNFKVANEFYYKASLYGGLSAREWFRRLVFPIYNIVKRK